MKKSKFKKIQLARFFVQILGTILTIAGFFTNFPVTLTILFGVTIFIGPIFCGWICPYGFLQDLLSKLGKVLGIKKRKMPRVIQKILVFSRYIILALVILVSFDFIFSIIGYDPRANLMVALMGNSITFVSVIIIVSFLAISLFFERPFCNYLCIEGAKYGLFSIFRPLTIKRNEHTCISCGKCDKVCPMNIEVSKNSQVRSAQCINCFECVESCPVKNTLTFSVAPVIKTSRKNLPIIVAATLFFFIYITYNVIEVTNGENVTSNQYNLENSTYNDNISTNSGDTLTTNIQNEAEINNDSNTQVIQGEAAQTFGDAAGIADGIYTGSGKGYKGNTTVQVTVENQLITEIVVTQTYDDAKWFDRAYNTIVSNIINTQSTSVDTVSGATFSSNGIIDAVEDALANAK